MPFRFRLESILRLRQGLERREELLLQKANQKVAQVRKEMEACLRELAERAATRQNQIWAGAFGSELHFDLSVDESIRARHSTLAAELKRVEALRDQQRERYQNARRERETLESIRSRELDAHRGAAQRRAQRAVDDLLLLRREFLRRG